LRSFFSTVFPTLTSADLPLSLTSILVDLEIISPCGSSVPHSKDCISLIQRPSRTGRLIFFALGLHHYFSGSFLGSREVTQVRTAFPLFPFSRFKAKSPPSNFLFLFSVNVGYQVSIWTLSVRFDSGRDSQIRTFLPPGIDLRAISLSPRFRLPTQRRLEPLRRLSPLSLSFLVLLLGKPFSRFSYNGTDTIPLRLLPPLLPSLVLVLESQSTGFLVLPRRWENQFGSSNEFLLVPPLSDIPPHTTLPPKTPFVHNGFLPHVFLTHSPPPRSELFQVNDDVQQCFFLPCASLFIGLRAVRTNRRPPLTPFSGLFSFTYSAPACFPALVTGPREQRETGFIFLFVLFPQCLFGPPSSPPRPPGRQWSRYTLTQ